MDRRYSEPETCSLILTHVKAFVKDESANPAREWTITLFDN